ncbi:hypothetical protein LCGC14_0016320 [marine sediment metagenome]|uniref:Uroporphyrinogen decarboxylase (URO-D) domain-containing protein n=1 Tax=marine sediment metagenome TaxID=412755 RepID=A0A0F9W1G2_9ZZZZ|nr:hypothetical protein [Phycisphaerae bacterium]HDZ42843.1 hypothetical protein [Phycisphaerae bacterium]
MHATNDTPLSDDGAAHSPEPDDIRVGVGILPSAWMKHRRDLFELVGRHPSIFGEQGDEPDYDNMAWGTYATGEHVDAWGCVWSNLHDGQEAIVTGHPLPRREDVRTLQPPTVDDGLPHGLMYLRLADLRGFEELMLDFAEEPPELQMLIDIVLGHNMRQLELVLVSCDGPGLITFGDDLGIQHGLPISPAKWRTYIKPCFAKLFGVCHEGGHSVFLHTDGCIIEIIGDLIECGVNVLNPQIRANGLDNLVRECKGKVEVCLDLDRQGFPFFTPAEIDAHVREAVEALGSPEGGLQLSAEVDDGVPLENIEAICCALEKYRGYFRDNARP